MAYQCIQFVPSSHDETIFRWKELLKSCNWTVPRSSDGSTVDNTGADKITGFGSGTGGFANSGAWFVLRMANTFAGSTYNREICVQRMSNGDGWYRIAYSLLGFSTGGTATVAPTATDEVYWTGYNLSGSFGMDGNWTGFFNPISSYPYRSFMAANDAAPYGFWCANLHILNTPYPGNPYNPAENLVGGSFMFDPMASGSFAAPTADNAATGDIDPYVWHFIRNYQGDSQGAFSLGWLQEATTHGARGWFRYGNSDAVFMRYISQSIVENSEYVRSNPYNGKLDLIPLYWFYPSSYSTYPNAFKGASSMAQFVLQNRSAGDTLSVSTPRDKIIFGNLALPWDGSLPIVG